MVKNGGEQHSAEYCQLNASELVPTLIDDTFALSQSLSILEYLDEKYPEPALLPKQIQQRALIRAFSQNIACDIHPLNNLRVLQYLQNVFALSEGEKSTWYKHWIELGMRSLEAQLTESNGQFCFGEQATFADCCLIPQVYNAKRFNIDVSAFPKIESIYQHCMTLDAFQQAAPDAQIDAS